MLSRGSDDLEVVVVGAGAAGLGAALRLAAAKVSFTVFEARNRVGGRAYTIADASFPLDLGCGWLHSADRNPWARIAADAGFTIDKTVPGWGTQSFDLGFSAEDQHVFALASRRFHERLEAIGPNAAELLEPDCRFNPLLNPRYPRLGVVVPAFVAVHWPSSSTPGFLGYKKIRNRAKQMTTQGDAAFFLASLLGYLDADNKRDFDANRKVLVAKNGFYVHCLGHSFGGRFLSAAIKAAASTPAVGRVLAAHRDTQYPFNVDSLCVLQMAAGKSAFGTEFSSLLGGPMCGPIILTHSTWDSALCNWHDVSEGEGGIGCMGATAPADRIGCTTLHPIDAPYTNAEFAKDITNVDASACFKVGGWLEGAHSDFWHNETLHLITSVVEQIRRY